MKLCIHVGAVFSVFTLIMSQGFMGVAAAGNGRIPLSALAGKASSISQGQFAICLNATSFVEESCETAGLVVPLNSLSLGTSTRDVRGNACETFTGVNSNLPVNASPQPPIIFNSTSRITAWDASTGSGDAAFTLYIGGKCNGANFDSIGATPVNTGTAHLVASDNGKRLDSLFTTFTDPVGGIGAFSLSGTNRQQ
jgi:hypothetical protein